MIELTIPGRPIAKKRPRFFRRGRHVGTYSAQAEEERAIKAAVAFQYAGEPLACPVALNCAFYMPIPKSTSKKNRARMLDGLLVHAKKPDVDNLLKMICDCLNGVVWADDRQIVTIRGVKIYGEKPRTEIVVEVL